MLGRTRRAATRGAGEGSRGRASEVEVPREQSSAGCGGSGRRAAMMRTHRAGDARRRARSGRRSSSAAGSPAVATTAAWCSSTCATPPGIVQVVVDPDTATSGVDPHAVRPSTCSASRASCAHRPEGTVNPDLATGRGRGRRDGVEVLNAVRAAADPDRRERRGRRGAPPAVPLPRPPQRSAAAQPPHCVRR